MSTPNHNTPFTRHLSFFTYSNGRSDIIKPYDSLRSALSLGFDFPIALAWAVAVPLLYGNTGPLSLYVSISRIPPAKTRTMLEHFPVRNESYTRQEITKIASSETKDWINWLHVFNLWTFAADAETGLVSRQDFEAFKEGRLLEELAKRRQAASMETRRQDVLPLLRGGPIWVGGHSLFVKMLFGVRVYEGQEAKRD